MKYSKAAALLSALVLALSLACTASPGTPSTSFGAPRSTSPENGTSYRYGDQPITVSVANAVRTQASTASYTIEVATNSDFSSVVFTKADVEEGADGTTRVTLGVLGGNATYYWRSRVTVEGMAGEPSTVRSFTVRPQIVIGTPNTNSPAAGTEVAAEQPTLTVGNASRSGPVTAIVYEFQIAAHSSFSPVIASGTAAEQQSSTSWTPTGAFTAGTYFWRARATDPASGEQGPFSAPISFNLTAFSLRMAQIMNSPPGIVDWPETTQITLLEFKGGPEDVSGIRIEFSKKDGPGRWPDVFPPGWAGPLQYCLGMVLKINGKYYADAPVQMWHGRERGGGAPSLFAKNWFYDPGRWGPMTGYQPATGEMIGFFVVAGVTRDHAHGKGDLSPVKERSNVVWVPMPTDAGATFTF